MSECALREPETFRGRVYLNEIFFYPHGGECCRMVVHFDEK